MRGSNRRACRRSPGMCCTGSRGLPWPGMSEWKLDRQQYLEWKRERQSRLDEVEQTRDGWQLLGGGGGLTLSPAAALRIWSAQSTVSQPVGVSVASTTVGTPVGPLGILAMALIAVFAPADVPKWPSATPHATRWVPARALPPKEVAGGPAGQLELVSRISVGPGVGRDRLRRVRR